MGNSASTAQLKVERAEKTGVLSLRDAGAEKVPEKIFRLANLRVLDLAHNRLPALPGAIGGLAQSTQLTLDRNRLKALPDVLCRLVKLESLSASENQLAQLPAGIGALVKLKKLNVSKNALLFLPPSLEKCAALQEVDVSHNQIAAFVNWAGLASLRDLNLSYNPIPELPSTSAAGLKRLKDLDLRGLDGLEGVPVGLLRDTPLERIELPKKLVAKDGLLVESAVGTDGLPVDVEYNKARAAYLARRKARIDKEMHAKDRGGEINFRG